MVGTCVDIYLVLFFFFFFSKVEKITKSGTEYGGGFAIAAATKSNLITSPSS